MLWILFCFAALVTVGGIAFVAVTGVLAAVLKIVFVVLMVYLLISLLGSLDTQMA
jgi:uncharacterized membrane protein YtjA (UPF0391 family)